MNKDLTVGNPERVLWKFTLPLLGSILFQQMYNIADSLIAGKFVGENALAAVGNAYEITLIFIAFAFGCNIGCSVVVSQFFGSKKYGEMKTAVSTTFIFSGVLCAALMVIGFIFSPSLLKLINTPDGVIADSVLYLNIYIGGLFFLFFYNIATGIFSAMGDSKTPFIFLALSSVSNIFADILFVTVFNMGVAGVAWATFICQFVSCVLSLVALGKRLGTVQTDGKIKKFSGAVFKKILAVSVPSILQQSCVSVGNIFVQSIINGFGTSVMAGYSAAIKINNLAITSFASLSNGVSNFAAQNFGAGKYDRIKKGFSGGLKMAYAICIPVILIYTLCGRWLIYAFMESPTGTAVDTGIMFLLIVSPFYLSVSVKIIADGILRGIGAMTKFMVATFADLLLRVVFAFALSKNFGVNGVWSAWPIGWVIATVLSVVFYKVSMKKYTKNKPTENLSE